MDVLDDVAIPQPLYIKPIVVGLPTIHIDDQTDHIVKCHLEITVRSMTASLVGDTSNDSNEYRLENLRTMSPAFWLRICNARISAPTQTVLDIFNISQSWYVRTSINHSHQH